MSSGLVVGAVIVVLFLILGSLTVFGYYFTAIGVAVVAIVAALALDHYEASSTRDALEARYGIELPGDFDVAGVGSQPIKLGGSTVLCLVSGGGEDAVLLCGTEELNEPELVG